MIRTWSSTRLSFRQVSKPVWFWQGDLNPTFQSNIYCIGMLMMFPCSWSAWAIVPAEGAMYLTVLFTCTAHEKKCISRGEAIAPVSQSKLSRVSSGFGLSKLTGSRRNRKESALNKNNLSAQVWAAVHYILNSQQPHCPLSGSRCSTVCIHHTTVKPCRLLQV